MHSFGPAELDAAIVNIFAKWQRPAAREALFMATSKPLWTQSATDEHLFSGIYNAVAGGSFGL